MGCKRCGCAENVAAESNGRSFRNPQDMRTNDIFDLASTKEKLVYLGVGVLKSLSDFSPVVCLRKEPGSSQDQTWQAAVTVKEFAEVLGSELSYTVNVLWNRCYFLCKPSCWRALGGR